MARLLSSLACLDSSVDRVVVVSITTTRFSSTDLAEKSRKNNSVGKNLSKSMRLRKVSLKTQGRTGRPNTPVGLDHSQPLERLAELLLVLQRRLVRLGLHLVLLRLHLQALCDSHQPLWNQITLLKHFVSCEAPPGILEPSWQEPCLDLESVCL